VHLQRTGNARRRRTNLPLFPSTAVCRAVSQRKREWQRTSRLRRRCVRVAVRYHREVSKKKRTYSCASLTSPVIAVRPMYGFGGRETSFSVKQSLHSSPVEIRTAFPRTKVQKDTHSPSTGSSPVYRKWFKIRTVSRKPAARRTSNTVSLT
jgi:hypothetical protein